MNSITGWLPLNNGYAITKERLPYELQEKKKTGFEIRPLSCLSKNDTYCIHISDASQIFVIVWIKKDDVTYVADAEKYEISTGLYCISGEGKQRFLFSENTKGYMLNFSRDLLHEINNGEFNFLNLLFQTAPSAISPEYLSDNKENLENIFSSLMNEFNCYRFQRNEIVKNLLKTLLSYLSYYYYNAGLLDSVRCSYLANKFFILFKKNYRQKKQVLDYASEMAITPGYLNEVIKNATGFSARDYIKRHIIEEAKRLAVCDGLTLKETAYYLGFDDLSHFSKYFKKIVGVNFTDFKRNGLPERRD